MGGASASRCVGKDASTPQRRAQESYHLNKLETQLAKAAKSSWGHGGVVVNAVTCGGSRIFAGAAGKLCHGKGAGNMEIGCAFETASVTKIATAVIVLQLVDEGLLSLDEAWSKVDGGSVGRLVQERVRCWPMARFGTATVRQLLQHTGGLPSYWEDDGFVAEFEKEERQRYTTWQLLGVAAGMHPACSPAQQGTAEGQHYADTNYLLLGLLVEQLAGVPLASAFRSRVFEVAGMSPAGTWCSYVEEPPKGAPSLSSRYMGSDMITGQPRHSAEGIAAGGMVSTAGDLAKLMAALSRGDLFPIGGAATLERMKSWMQIGVGMYYGLGLMRIDLPDAVSLTERVRGRGQLRGHLWGHSGFGGAFVWAWEAPGRDGAVITGTTNNTERDEEKLICRIIRAQSAAS